MLFGHSKMPARIGPRQKNAFAAKKMQKMHLSLAANRINASDASSREINKSIKCINSKY